MAADATEHAIAARRSALLTCDDFPDLSCCEGCHVDWDMAEIGIDEPSRAAEFLPTMLLMADGRIAAVCCTIARELVGRRGAREFRLRGEDAPVT